MYLEHSKSDLIDFVFQKTFLNTFWSVGVNEFFLISPINVNIFRTKYIKLKANFNNIILTKTKYMSATDCR